MRISDWSSDVCSSDLPGALPVSRSCVGAHSGATASPAKRRAPVRSYIDKRRAPVRSCIDKRRAPGVSTAVAVADRIPPFAAEGAPRHLRTRRRLVALPPAGAYQAPPAVECGGVQAGGTDLVAAPCPGT